MNSKLIPMSTIRELQSEMKKAQQRDPEEVSLLGAIKVLAPDIRAMQARGYGLERIAAMLGGKGIEMTAVTLKSYLQRVGGGAGVMKRQKAAPGASRGAISGASRGAISGAPSGASSGANAEGVAAPAARGSEPRPAAGRQPEKAPIVAAREVVSERAPLAPRPSPPAPRAAEETAALATTAPLTRYAAFIPPPDTEDI